MLSSVGISFNAVPACLVGLIELLLYLLYTIPASDKEPSKNERIRFFSGSLKLLSCLFSQFGIPRNPIFVTPVKMLGCPENFSVQAEGFGSVRSQLAGGTLVRNPNLWRHWLYSKASCLLTNVNHPC